MRLAFVILAAAACGKTTAPTESKPVAPPAQPKPAPAPPAEVAAKDAVVIATGLDDCEALVAADDRDAYVVHSKSGAIDRIALEGGQTKTIAKLPPNTTAIAMAAGAEGVYLSIVPNDLEAPTGRMIAFAPAAGGALKSLAADYGAVHSLALDDHRAVFAGMKPGAGLAYAIAWVPREGGTTVSARDATVDGVYGIWHDYAITTSAMDGLSAIPLDAKADPIPLAPLGIGPSHVAYAGDRVALAWRDDQQITRFQLVELGAQPRVRELASAKLDDHVAIAGVALRGGEVYALRPGTLEHPDDGALVHVESGKLVDVVPHADAPSGLVSVPRGLVWLDLHDRSKTGAKLMLLPFSAAASPAAR